MKRVIGDFKLCNEVYDILVADTYDIAMLAEIATKVLGKKVSVLNKEEGTLEVEEPEPMDRFKQAVAKQVAKE